MTNRTDGDCVVIRYAVHVHLLARVIAHLIARHAAAETRRKRHAFRIAYANSEIVFAKSTRVRRAVDACVAIIDVIATRGATKGHFIDVAAIGAFLARETSKNVIVVGNASRIRGITHVVAHLITRRTCVVTSYQIRAVGIEGARLQFV